MKKIFEILAILLLLFNGIGALYGGWLLIVQPDGSGLGIPLSYLEHSPFDNFLIPGLVLFTVNGLFSIWIVLVTVLKRRWYYGYIVAQGVILTGWIVIQIIMVRDFNALHAIMGSTGLLLILSGYILKGTNERKQIAV